MSGWSGFPELGGAPGSSGSGMSYADGRWLEDAFNRYADRLDAIASAAEATTGQAVEAAGKVLEAAKQQSPIEFARELRGATETLAQMARGFAEYAREQSQPVINLPPAEFAIPAPVVREIPAPQVHVDFAGLLSEIRKGFARLEKLLAAEREKTIVHVFDQQGNLVQSIVKERVTK